MRWKNQPFSVKLFICIFTTSFLLLVIGSAVILGASYHKTAEMNRILTADNIEVTGKNIEQMLDRIDTAVQLAFYQQNVLAAVRDDYSKNPSAQNTAQHALAVAVASDDIITHMSLCSEKNGILSTQGNITLPYNDMDSFSAYYTGLIETLNTQSQAWYFLESDPLHPTQCALTNIRRITPGGSKEQLYLAVTLSETALENTYGFLGENSFLITEDGTIISSAQKSMIGTTVEPKLLLSAQGTNGKSTYLFDDGQSTFYSTYISTISCYLVVDISTDALSTFKNAMIVIIGMVFVFGLVLSFIWAKYIAATLTKPMMSLKSVMESAMGGNMDIRSEAVYQDEIGYLCNSFNQMMDNLDGYMIKFKSQQELVKETEIRLLQSQINPHLLYNTIDSAIFLMSHHEVDRSICVLEALSSYFKMALQKGNQEITIYAAIEHIRSYLRLQNLCRMKNYTLNVDCQPEVLSCTILHMLMQPIVENAVLHGFDGNFADGTINLRIIREEEQLCITVTDNGMGMTDEELMDLRNAISAETPKGKGFALWNVARRVRMRYGKEYGLSVESEFGEYTEVTLTIPCLDQSTTQNARENR